MTELEAKTGQIGTFRLECTDRRWNFSDLSKRERMWLRKILWVMIEIHIVMNVPISFYYPTTILQEQTHDPARVGAHAGKASFLPTYIEMSDIQPGPEARLRSPAKMAGAP